MSGPTINVEALASALLLLGFKLDGTTLSGANTNSAGLVEEPKQMSASAVRGDHVDCDRATDRGEEIQDAGGVGQPLCGPESVGSGSWSDAVEDEIRSEEKTTSSVDGGSVSGDSVTFSGVKPELSEAVASVRFGGMVDSFPASDPVVVEKKGFFATIVRNNRALSLAQVMEKAIGSKMPKASRENLAICTFTAASMPDAIQNGKQRLRSLAAIGDAALTLHLTVSQWAKGGDVASGQALRSRVTSNKHLQQVMVKNALIGCVSYGAGIDPETCTATATAFEAMLGVLVLYQSPEAVRKFLAYVGFEL